METNCPGCGNCLADCGSLCAGGKNQQYDSKYYYFPLSDFLDEIYELKEYKKDVVKYQKEIRQKLPILLEEIGKSKELRTLFNEEFSKHKDIIEGLQYELAKPDNLDQPVKKLLKK